MQNPTGDMQNPTGDMQKVMGGNPINPRRYAMFAWKTRYIVDDSDVVPQEPNIDTQVQVGGYEEITEQDADSIALAKLQFPTIYTITKNESIPPTVTWGILNPKQFIGL